MLTIDCALPAEHDDAFRKIQSKFTQNACSMQNMVSNEFSLKIQHDENFKNEFTVGSGNTELISDSTRGNLIL